MKRSVFLTLAMCAFALSARATFAQEAELAPPIKTCIDENAPKVEKAVPSLADATSFLVESVCADTIAAEQSRLTKLASQKMIERYQQLCAAEKSPPPKSSDPDEASTDPCAIAKSLSDMNAFGVGGGWTIYAGRQSSPGPTSYAAKLLLSIRLAHMNSKSQ